MAKHIARSPPGIARSLNSNLSETAEFNFGIYAAFRVLTVFVVRILANCEKKIFCLDWHHIVFAISLQKFYSNVVICEFSGWQLTKFVHNVAAESSPCRPISLKMAS